ncbi:LysR family transcriptional regulator [Mesorhizobium xinjiangense]|uniref:LysR family transcriptional regulator n=1 Tax=Mesorhizobium xinjiangense TaxID=2678685 RepID=UPI0012EE1BA5|nr:LysR family transcriptional regulator [Mesorhizobium xinjiangense]
MDPYRLGLIATRAHYFQLVARLGSIRQASKALNVAPSSISRVIKQLEEELDTPLFERVRQRLRLTSAGELLLYHVRESYVDLNRAVTEINDLSGLRRGTVTVAVIESVARGILPDALEEFWQRHPEITVDTKVTSSQEAVNAVSEGSCDLAIAFDVRVPRNARRLASIAVPLGVIVPPDSHLAEREELRPFEISGERIILSDTSLSLAMSVDELFAGSMVEILRRARTNSIGLMIDLAKRGQGSILQTRVGVERETRSGELRFIPLRDPKLQPRRLMLMSRSKGEISEAASAFATSLSQRFEQLKA